MKSNESGSMKHLLNSVLIAFSTTILMLLLISQIIDTFFWSYDFIMDILYFTLFLIASILAIKIKDKKTKLFIFISVLLIAIINIIEALITASYNFGRQPIYVGSLSLIFQLLAYCAMFSLVLGIRRFFKNGI